MEGKVIVDDCLINIDEFENYQKQYTDYEIVGDTHLVGIPEKKWILPSIFIHFLL